MSRFFDLVSKPAREMLVAPATSSGPPAVQSRLIKLDSNENPFGPSPRAIEAMRTALASVHGYPDAACGELRERLATQHSVPQEQVLVTAGSTELLSLLSLAMLGHGLNAVTSERSFLVYRMVVEAAGAQLVEVPMRNNGLDLQAMLDRINEHTRIIFLANPNNPTGTVVDLAELDKFMSEVPGHVVVVLDEAYYDFAQHFATLREMEYSRSFSYLRQGASVIILRTFSKAHGLAGLRIGYGIGPAELLGYCARMQSMFSVSSIAQAGALAALDDLEHLTKTVTNNASQAQILGVALSELDFQVTPTSANFLCCDLGENAASMADQLRQAGVSIRPLGDWGAPTCIRISIGTPEQNQFFLEALSRIREESSHATGSESQ